MNPNKPTRTNKPKRADPNQPTESLQPNRTNLNQIVAIEKSARKSHVKMFGFSWFVQFGLSRLC